MAAERNDSLSLYKTESIASTSSLDEPPSLCSGRADSVSSMGDHDDWSEHDPQEVLTVTGLKADDDEEDQELEAACGGDLRCSPPATHESEKRKARELLTDREKRKNHIAAEQKRRHTIRIGFKELSDVLPSLNTKDANHSKSTILFKAADYIRQLDKRNKMLRDRIHSLQIRAQLHAEPRHPYTPSPSYLSAYTNPATAAALSAHKQQSRQLETSQSRLRLVCRPGTHPSLSIPSSPELRCGPTATIASLPLPRRSAIVNSAPYQALVMPAEAPYSYSVPCVNIPADEEFEKESAFRERLLSCGKLMS